MRIDTRYKIVIDTNIIVAATPEYSPYHKILDSLLKGNFDLYIDHEILLEYEEVLTSYFDPETGLIITSALIAMPNVYQIETWFHWQLILNDPDDNKFVDCAFACNAQFIISNDKHFNVLKHISFPKITVLKIDEFMALLESL